jgi:hypothetical protein
MPKGILNLPADVICAIVARIGANKSVAQTCKTLHQTQHNTPTGELHVCFRLSRIPADTLPRHIENFVRFYRLAHALRVTVDLCFSAASHDSSLARNRALVAALETALAEAPQHVAAFSLRSRDFELERQTTFSAACLSAILRRSAPSLRSLHLNGQVFSAADFEPVARALQHANRLQTLEIRGHLPLARHHAASNTPDAENTVQKSMDQIWECVVSAIEHRKQTLVDVSLSMIKFCDETLMQLFNVLASSVPPTSIQTLSFYGTVVTGDGFFEAPAPAFCSAAFDDALFVDAYRVVVHPISTPA